MREENPLLAASAAIPPSLPPDPHLAGFRGGHNFSTRLGKLLGTIFSIFKTVKQTFLLHQSPQTAPKKEVGEKVCVVVTPPPSSGQPGKLCTHQPTRSKPASVEARPARADYPKTTTTATL